jgi:hypothetical protein
MIQPQGGLLPACCAPPASKTRPSTRQNTSLHGATSTLLAAFSWISRMCGRPNYRWRTKISSDTMNLNIQIVTLALPIVLASRASDGPYQPNTSTEPRLNSVRGPADGRYRLAFIEFGDQGSALDTSQRKAALEVIHEAKRPLLFVYIHGWQNNAESTRTAFQNVLWIR